MATLYESPAELEYQLRALGGVPVAYLDYSTWGDHQLESLETGDGPSVVAEEESVIVVTARIAQLKRGVAITVNGELREISEFRKEPPDAVYTRIFLKRRNPQNRAHRRS